MWLVYALMAAIFWAAGSVLMKKAVSQMPKQLIYLANASFFLFSWMVLWAIKGGFSWDLMAFCLAAAPGLGFIYVMWSYSKVDVSLINSVGSIHPAVTALLAVSFLGEVLNLNQQYLIGSVIVGVLVMGWPGKRRLEVQKDLSWLWWGLGFGLLSGVNNFLSKLGMNRVGSLSFSLMIAWWQIGMALSWLALGKDWQKVKKLWQKNNRTGLLGAGIYNLGAVAFLTAVGLGKVSLVMPVVNLFVPLSLVLAAWWLKERMTSRQKLGAGVVIGSVIGLSLVSYRS